MATKRVIKKRTTADRRKMAMALPAGTRSKGARKVYAIANRLRDASDLTRELRGAEFLTTNEEQRLLDLSNRFSDLMIEVGQIAHDIHFNSEDRR